MVDLHLDLADRPQTPFAPWPRAATRRPCRAFTLIELMVVILIITILAAIAYPTLMVARRRMRVAGTEQLVNILCARITSNVVLTVRLPKSGEERRLWDFNHDGLVDGDPERDQGFSAAQRREAVQANYHGLLADLGIGLPPAQVDPVQGRPRDAWGAALRIGFGAKRYGAYGIGVWSDGPDRRNGTDDDITSWNTGK